MEQRIERIIWVDHHGSDGDWWSLHDIKEYARKPWRITTVGILIYEDDATVVLAHQAHEAKGGKMEYKSWAAIVKKLIVSRETLMTAAFGSGFVVDRED